MNIEGHSDTATATPQPSSIYHPRGGAKRLFESRDSELLICGPSGTGKSRACLEKVNALCELHPSIRILVSRKSRKSLSESVLAEFEASVLPPGSPLLLGADRSHRSKYKYSNGSTIVLGGLDDPSRIMSSQYDVVYCNEATELSEHEFEILLSRLRNNQLRDRKTGELWHQMICDCNPSAPTHWLKQRCDRGQMTYIESRHEDNPACSAEYIQRLSELTGFRRKRLYEGIWFAAEGAVYDSWDRSIHLIDRFDIPEDWLRIRAVDFGFRDPFVCLWIAVDPDGRLFVYRQLYMSGRLVEDHVGDILELSHNEAIAATITDHASEERGVLERAGIPTVGARKHILVGVQQMQARLRGSADGRPRLFVLRDSLVERDKTLAAAKRPTCLEEEFESYEWSAPKADQILKELPRDRDNHALDSLRYGVMALTTAESIRNRPPPTVVISYPPAPRKIGKGIRNGWGRHDY